MYVTIVCVDRLSLCLALSRAISTLPLFDQVLRNLAECPINSIDGSGSPNPFKEVGIRPAAVVDNSLYRWSGTEFPSSFMRFRFFSTRDCNLHVFYEGLFCVGFNVLLYVYMFISHCVLLLCLGLVYDNK